MNSFSDLLDVDTWARLVKAAPKVTVVPADAARMAVKALSAWMTDHASHTDLEGKRYWEASLKELIEVDHIAGVIPNALGRALRAMGLTLWREGDGYHAAWSDEQFKILKKYFKV